MTKSKNEYRGKVFGLICGLILGFYFLGTWAYREVLLSEAIEVEMVVTEVPGSCLARQQKIQLAFDGATYWMSIGRRGCRSGKFFEGKRQKVLFSPGYPEVFQRSYTNIYQLLFALVVLGVTFWLYRTQIRGKA